MQASDIPTKLPVPFASSAGAGYIRTVPVPSQIGIQDGAASYTDGFPPLTMTPEGSGGVPPFGQDVNYIEKINTAWLRWFQAGVAPVFDSTFSSDIGGYPKGAIVMSASTLGAFWFSTADNNTSDPDAGGADWVTFLPGSFYGVDTGTANAAVVTLSPAPVSLAWMTGRQIVIKKAASSNTGAVTLNLNGFGAKSVVHPDGSACAAGDLPGSGIFTVVYDGTAFEVSSGLPSASGVTVLQLQEQAGNYAEDTGTTNVLVATLPTVPPSWASLIGAPVRIKVLHTTTSGAPTLNLNGLGAKVLINPDGSALVTGQLPAGAIVETIYDGTHVQVLSITIPFPVSTVAEVEAGTSVTSAVSPGRAVYHDSAVKAWAVAAADGSILASYNVASCAHGATGDYVFQLSGGLNFFLGVYVANSLQTLDGPRIASSHGAISGVDPTAHVSVTDAVGDPADGITTIIVVGHTQN